MITHPIAKINLGLNVVERRPDGYHNLETVFFPVPICDVLEVENQSSMLKAQSSKLNDCELTLEGIAIEGDVQKNLIVKAYQLLKEDHPDMPRVRARLKKGIPTQAGMGGGSSDGAYMLTMLNELFQLHLTKEQLCGYAARLGADCAFFIDPQPQYAEGIGERLSPVVLNLSDWYIGVVRPDVPVSTKEAYSLIKPKRPLRNCRDIVMQPVETWRDELINDFEEGVFALHPELAEVKQRLYDLGAVYAAMSGSGSAIFGLFREPVELESSFPDMFTWCAPLTTHHSPLTK
jgi:4-diphosphocytidyl-2-C-methyl-D-erythritol kinase